MVEVRLKTGWQEIISHVAGDLALSDFLLLQQLNQPQQPFGSTFSASTPLSALGKFRPSNVEST